MFINFKFRVINLNACKLLHVSILIIIIKKITIASGTWLHSWLLSLSPPDMNKNPIKWNGFLGNWSPWSTAYILGLQEPQSNEMDFLEIDLLGPQPIRLTKSATTCSTIHQKTMWNLTSNQVDYQLQPQLFDA